MTKAHKPAKHAAKSEKAKGETPARFRADLQHAFDQAVQYALTADPSRPEGATWADAVKVITDAARDWIDDYEFGLASEDGNGLDNDMPESDDPDADRIARQLGL